MRMNRKPNLNVTCRGGQLRAPYEDQTTLQNLSLRLGDKEDEPAHEEITQTVHGDRSDRGVVEEGDHHLTIAPCWSGVPHINVPVLFSHQPQRRVC